MPLCVCVCVCVCMRERERERERHTHTHTQTCMRTHKHTQSTCTMWFRLIFNDNKIRCQNWISTCYQLSTWSRLAALLHSTLPETQNIRHLSPNNILTMPHGPLQMQQKLGCVDVSSLHYTHTTALLLISQKLMIEKHCPLLHPMGLLNTHTHIHTHTHT